MARGIGVILVILSHLDAVDPAVLTWISVFHMPLFFVLSGVTMSLWTDRRESLKEQIGRRSRSLLLPYLWFSLLYFLIDIGNLLLGKIDGRRFAENILLSLSFAGKSVLWYVSALLLSQLLLLLINRIGKRPVRILLIVLIAAACAALSYPWRTLAETEGLSMPAVFALDLAKALLRAGVVLPFVAAAGVLGRFIREKQLLKGALPRMLIGLAALGLSILISKYHWSDTNNLRLGNPLLYYAGGIAGSVAVIALISLIPGGKLTAGIGRDSLVILAVHLDCYVLWAGLKAAGVLAGLFPAAAGAVAGILYIAVAVAVTVFLGWIAARLIDCCFPFVMGRKRKGPKDGR